MPHITVDGRAVELYAATDEELTGALTELKLCLMSMSEQIRQAKTSYHLTGQRAGQDWWTRVHQAKHLTTQERLQIEQELAARRSSRRISAAFDRLQRDRQGNHRQQHDQAYQLVTAFIVAAYELLPRRRFKAVMNRAKEIVRGT